MNSVGTVYLVGAGPGDPDLLTVKGLQCLQKCDVVIYDALANPALLDHCPPHAEKIFAGKRRHRHSFEQSEINAMILKHARDGKMVCRLKGGDPFLFGRGGEEAEFLFTHGVPFEVIPGVSSIIGAPASAGIPLTHRDYASHVTVVTGQNSGMENDAPDERWEPYHYLGKKTLVILMGFAHTESIMERLLSFGWPAETPVALICSGTSPEEIVVTGRLDRFGAKARRLQSLLSPPAMLVVGKVVGAREKISPSAFDFDLLPLQDLKAHEGAIPERVQKIKEEIAAAGEILTPLWVDKQRSIVLNGHHRLAALKELGCGYAPCLLLDYSSPYVRVEVCPGAAVETIDKESVVQAALNSNLFPPRSSFHVLAFEPPRLVIPLAALMEKESLEV